MLVAGGLAAPISKTPQAIVNKLRIIVSSYAAGGIFSNFVRSAPS
jgi:hypothetical protein